MRIAYLCYWDGRRRDGVAEKISSQLAAWRGHGHEAELFLLTPAGPEYRLEGETFAFDGTVSRFAATRRLDAAVRAHRPDVVYLRYDVFLPPPVRAVRAAPTVVEVNSDFEAELRVRSPRAALYERLQRPLLVGRAAGAVCVTHELARALRARQPGLAVEVIANGIDLDALPRLAAPAPDGPPRLAYLGEDVYWQGVDKVFALARALPEWRFDLVGVDASRSADNVACHGFLEREAYEPILARADAAIGTLALHRKRMHEACALKTRQYLAYGLPVVLGHEDTDFAGQDPWFLLRLPNTEPNVADGVERVRAFVEGVRGRRVERREVEGRLSIAVKEAHRLELLERVVGR
jgi:glycosyltransferase involved in cell wall biosynthesis